MDNSPPTSTSNNKNQDRTCSALTIELFYLFQKNLGLDTYLTQHSQLLKDFLQPRGFIYYLRSGGQGLQPTLNFEAEDIFSDILTQKKTQLPFNEALQAAIQKVSPLFLLPDASSEKSSISSNPTPYIQCFLPFVIHQQVIGILQVWIEPCAENTFREQTALLSVLIQELEFFVKTVQSQELLREINPIIQYTHLLDQLSGDSELDTVCWNLVNYARETTSCNRVCLILPHTFLSSKDPNFLEKLKVEKFKLQSASGLKTTQHRSEQAVLLANTAQELVVEQFVKNQPPAPKDKSQATAGFALDYFKSTAMAWTLALPVWDKDQALCGIMLFEGKNLEANLPFLLVRIQSLSKTAGLALSNALKWEKNIPLKIAHYIGNFFKKHTKKSRKLILLKTLLGFGVVVLILCIPLPYNITAETTIIPQEQITIPATRIAQLQNVYVHPGDFVKKGQPLLQLNTEELQYQLQAVQQEHLQNLIQVDEARLHGNEAEAQLTLAQASGVKAVADRLELELEKSTVKAPFDGTILGPAHLTQLKGKIIQEGEPIIRMANLERWTVKASLREQDIPLIQKYLNKKGCLSAKLHLLSLPTKSFDLELCDEKQLTYGTTFLTDDYTYFAIFALKTPLLSQIQTLKTGYKGKTEISIGWKTVAYHLFRDFKEYLQGRFFF